MIIDIPRPKTKAVDLETMLHLRFQIALASTFELTKRVPVKVGQPIVHFDILEAGGVMTAELFYDDGTWYRSIGINYAPIRVSQNDTATLHMHWDSFLGIDQ